MKAPILTALTAGVLLASAKHDERLHNAASVLQEIIDTPDQAIPQELLDRAHCAVIVPGDRHGGLNQNLLDAHPPFQIAGNFGFTAGIAEMLLQRHLYSSPTGTTGVQSGKADLAHLLATRRECGRWAA